MLQVDPCKRIKMNDIKNHPWLRTKIPIYSKISSNFSLQKEEEFELDHPILEEVKKMNFSNVNEFSQEKIIKSIKKRDDQSFVITYELLKDQKQRKIFAQQNVQKFDNPKQLVTTIFEQVENMIIKQKKTESTEFIYGKRFSKPPKILAEIMIQALKKIGIDFSIKNPDYCLKCVYVPFNFKRLARKHKGSDPKEQKNQKQLKYTKKEIKFTLQIYGIGQSGYEHLIDLQLTQGHPLVFFSVVQKFYDMMDDLMK